MLTQLLFPDTADVQLTNIRVADHTIMLELQMNRTHAACPTCGMVSQRIHSRYTRRPRDLAWAGAAVRWQLQVRRFRCQHRPCPQQLFAERLPTLVAPSARRTIRLTKLLHQVGLMAGARAGSRLSTLLGSGTSASTLLRILRAAPLPAPGQPKVVGLDEWAWRKGRTYGTIIVDLEAHRVLDLLPDCRSEHVAAWLRRHPSITVISRDRSGPFATAATQGAPHATQVADRFHLLKNLTETLLRVFEQHRSELNNVRRIGDQPTAAPLTEAPTGHRPSAATQRGAGRTQRHLRYQQVRHLYASGMAQTRIAHQMGLSCKTVRRWVRATAYPAHPGAKRRGRPYGSQLDPFKPYLLERFQAGCHNARRLYQEIQVQGYRGCDSLVRKYITVLRRVAVQGLPIPTKPTRQYSLADLAFAVLRPPQKLTQADQTVLAELEAAHETLRTACRLARSFAVMVRERRAPDLQPWLEQAAASGIAAFRTFVVGLRRDEAAVRAGLTLPWSQGQVEGHIHRLKLIKRTGYGRASFDLLRQRVLATPA